MTVIFYTFIQIVQLFLDALFFLLFVRAIMSWLPIDEGSWLNQFVFALTEPFIYPFRILTEKISFFQGSPLDFSFMLAMFALLIVRALLNIFPVIHI